MRNAIAEAITLFEENFPRMVFTKEKEKIWQDSLQEFPENVIRDAARDCLETHRYPDGPMLADIRTHCNERMANIRIEKKYGYPKDFKSLPSGATDKDPFGDQIDGNNNWKMVRIQHAWILGRKRDGKEVNRIPDEQKVRERISEYDGISYDLYYQKTKEILNCE